MTGVALKSGNSEVQCTDGAIGTVCGVGKWLWDTPTIQLSDEGSTNVFVNSIGIVRLGDKMVAHPDGTICTSTPVLHSPALSEASTSVFANGKGIGRIGDKYNSDGHMDHVIISGSTNVFVGGYGGEITINNALMLQDGTFLLTQDGSYLELQ